MLTSMQLLALAVYRLLLHPLARVPGSLLQRLSGLPRIWQCYVGDRFLKEMEAHDKYGKSVLYNRLG